MVRLGEYDTSTTEDGQHLDVNIADAEEHINWNQRWLINDIGMVYFYEDVVFNGMNEKCSMILLDD